MSHDRVHAQPPHDPENWRVGTVQSVSERDGHAVFTVRPGSDAPVTDSTDGTRIDLVVTFAVRDLVLRRLDDDEPVGQRVWFRKRGEGG